MGLAPLEVASLRRPGAGTSTTVTTGGLVAPEPRAACSTAALTCWIRAARLEPSVRRNKKVTLGPAGGWGAGPQPSRAGGGLQVGGRGRGQSVRLRQYCLPTCIPPAPGASLVPSSPLWRGPRWRHGRRRWRGRR